MQPLDPASVPGLLASLPEWRFDAARGAIHRRYLLQDFVQAFSFMTQVALAAERRDHHPEWSNVYKTVDITWTTHDAGGLTARDIEMARLCDHAFSGYPPAGRAPG